MFEHVQMPAKKLVTYTQGSNLVYIWKKDLLNPKKEKILKTLKLKSIKRIALLKQQQQQYDLFLI